VSKKPAGIGSHLARRVGVVSYSFSLLPWPLIVDGDHLPASLAQQVNPTRRPPVYRGIGRETMDQQDGFSLPVNIEGNLDSV
jgi:hypothetical protein